MAEDTHGGIDTGQKRGAAVATLGVMGVFAGFGLLPRGCTTVIRSAARAAPRAAVRHVDDLAWSRAALRPPVAVLPGRVLRPTALLFDEFATSSIDDVARTVARSSQVAVHDGSGRLVVNAVEKSASTREVELLFGRAVREAGRLLDSPLRDAVQRTLLELAQSSEHYKVDEDSGIVTLRPHPGAHTVTFSVRDVAKKLAIATKGTETIDLVIRPSGTTELPR